MVGWDCTTHYTLHTTTTQHSKQQVLSWGGRRGRVVTVALDLLYPNLAYGTTLNLPACPCYWTNGFPIWVFSFPSRPHPNIPSDVSRRPAWQTCVHKGINRPTLHGCRKCQKRLFATQILFAAIISSKARSTTMIMQMWIQASTPTIAPLLQWIEHLFRAIECPKYNAGTSDRQDATSRPPLSPLRRIPTANGPLGMRRSRKASAKLWKDAELT